MTTENEMKKAIIIIAAIFIVAGMLLPILPSDGPGIPRQASSTILSDAPALMSCADLQRELNRLDPKLKLKVDGICGPATMRAWDDAVNTQYALSLWPVDE